MPFDGGDRLRPLSIISDLGAALTTLPAYEPEGRVFESLRAHQFADHDLLISNQNPVIPSDCEFLDLLVLLERVGGGLNFLTWPWRCKWAR